MTHNRLQAKLVLACFFMLTGVAAGSELTDIRTGSHRYFSRLVIEFDRNVQFQVNKASHSRSIEITARPVRALTDTGLLKVDSSDVFIDSVARVLSRQGLSVHVALRTPDVHLRYYTMRAPFRIVVDIYPKRAHVQKTTPATPNLASAAASPQDSTIVPQAIEAQQPANTEETPPEITTITADTARSEEMSPEVTEITADSANQESSRSFAAASDSNALAAHFKSISRDVEAKLQEIFRLTGSEKAVSAKSPDRPNQQARRKLDVSFTILAILGFLLVDILLVSYYVRSRKHKKNMKHKTKPRKVRSVKTKQQPEPVADARSATENETFEDPQSDFIAALTNMLETEPGLIPVPTTGGPDQSDDLNSIQHAVKVDTMIASLSEAITKPASDIQYIPELNDVVQDLEVVTSSPGSMHDLSSDELVGKDGEAFLRNLRRDSLF